MNEYLVIFHTWKDGSWGAFVPDVPDVLAVGETREEAAEAIEDALAEHVETLAGQGMPLPPALHTAGTVAVRPAASGGRDGSDAEVYAAR